MHIGDHDQNAAAAADDLKLSLKGEENKNIVRQYYENVNKAIGRRPSRHFLESTTFIATPLASAIASWYLYPYTSVGFHQLVQFLSQNNWEPVDGGQLQWSILLPALNGVVMTAISLLYANLISTTGSSLRERQITIHTSLSQEILGIQNLVQLLKYYPSSPANGQGVTESSISPMKFGQQLKSYLRILIDETNPNLFSSNESLESLKADNEVLWQYRDGLHQLSVEMGSTSSSATIDGTILERSYESLQQVQDARTTRITALQTKFPRLHYLTITTLTLAILFVFLLETDRKLILYLDKFQIRTVWALLVGTVTAIYCIGIDLAQPFIGTYTIPAEQLLVEGNTNLLQQIDSACHNIIDTTQHIDNKNDGVASTKNYEEENNNRSAPSTTHGDLLTPLNPDLSSSSFLVDENDYPNIAAEQYGVETGKRRIVIQDQLEETIVSSTSSSSFFDKNSDDRQRQKDESSSQTLAYSAVDGSKQIETQRDDNSNLNERKNDDGGMSLYEEYMRGRSKET